MRVLCIKILNGEDVNYGEFDKVIDFVRNYADKHHHNKEEAILFKKMGDELGENVSKGPIAGMLVEHDFGRLFMSNLEAAVDRVKKGDRDSRVDVIANAIGYADLLDRHIQKEDDVIYKFARRSLKEEAMKNVEQLCEEVENKAVSDKLQQKYIDLIEEFEQKYIK